MKPKYFTAFLFLVLISSPAVAQTVDSRKLSKLGLSEDLRARLAERLSSFLEYELTEQFEKQYDLLATKCPEGYTFICAPGTKMDYIRNKGKERDIYGTLLELKFEGVGREMRDNCVFPILKQKFRRGKFVSKPVTLAIACIQNGDWYFHLGTVEI